MRGQDPALRGAGALALGDLGLDLDPTLCSQFTRLFPGVSISSPAVRRTLVEPSHKGIGVWVQ